MQFHGVLGCFSPTCGSSLLSARSCKMHDHREPHVEPEHPDHAVTFTTESSEVPQEESGVSGVNGEKQDCSSEASKADHIQTEQADSNQWFNC